VRDSCRGGCASRTRRALSRSRSESSRARASDRHSRWGLGAAYGARNGGPAAELGLLERLSYGAFVARRTSLPVLGRARLGRLLHERLTRRDFGVSTRGSRISRVIPMRTHGSPPGCCAHKHQSHRPRHQQHALWRATYEFSSAECRSCPRRLVYGRRAKRECSASCPASRAAAIVCGALRVDRGASARGARRPSPAPAIRLSGVALLDGGLNVETPQSCFGRGAARIAKTAHSCSPPSALPA